MPDSKIPFTVIGGYLGAGKTTLLNHILHHSDGRRLALLINDFGSVNIDAELIENQDGDTINLANGCICCSLVTGFVVALNTVLERQPQPEHIVVEASGVSDPRKIAIYGQTPQFRLDGIIVVADAETVRARSQDKYVGLTVMRQLESADLIVLNKTDLITMREKLEILDWLNRTAPQAQIVEALYGQVPPQLLLGIGTGQMTGAAAATSDEHSHEATYKTWVYMSSKPTSRRAFEAYISQLPDTVLRGKGFVYLDDEPDHPMIFQLVGRRWSLEPGQRSETELPHTRVVFIGLEEPS